MKLSQIREHQIAEFKRLQTISLTIDEHRDELMAVIAKITKGLGDQIVSISETDPQREGAVSDQEIATIREHIILIYTAAFLTGRLPMADMLAEHINMAHGQGWFAGEGCRHPDIPRQ